MDRVAIFIDGAYLDFGLRDHAPGVRLDFGLLSRTLANGKEILRSYYYHCPPYQSNPPTAEERNRVSRRQAFFAQLNRLPRFQVRLGQLAYRGEKPNGKPILVQKRVDIMLGVDLVQLSIKDQIRTAVLLAGDSDFLPAVQVAREEGVLVHLFHFERPHRELWDACDERTLIDQPLIEKIKDRDFCADPQGAEVT